MMKQTLMVKLMATTLALPLWASIAHAAPQITGKTLNFAIPAAKQSGQVVCQFATKSTKEFVDEATVTETYHGECYLTHGSNRQPVRTTISFQQFANHPTQFELHTELPRDHKITSTCRITGKINKKIKRNSSRKALNFAVARVQYFCDANDNGNSLKAKAVKQLTQVAPELSVKISA